MISLTIIANDKKKKNKRCWVFVEPLWIRDAAKNVHSVGALYME